MDYPTEVILTVRALKDESKRFFHAAGRFLDWRVAPEDVFMDIGCGSGDSTTNLLKVLPDIQKVVGIDFVPSRIDNAKTANKDDKVEYRVADILDWSSLAEWEGSLSKIVSFYCFHDLNDQRLAFENVYRLLKPGGSAAISMLLNSPHFDVIKELSEHERYKKFMQDVENIIPKSHIMKFTSSHYRKILEEVGFEVIFCKEIDRNVTFASNDECRRIICATIPTTKVPSDKKQEFINYIFKLHRDHSNPLMVNGLLYLKQCTISIFIRKPL